MYQINGTALHFLNTKIMKLGHQLKWFDHVAQSVGTTPYKTEVTSSNPHLPPRVDISKNQKKKKKKKKKWFDKAHHTCHTQEIYYYSSKESYKPGL
jgi:hypothetical protein